MRITARELRQIIREELHRGISEGDETAADVAKLPNAPKMVPVNDPNRYKGQLPDRPLSQVKQDFQVAKNALTARRFSLYSNNKDSRAKWSDLSWLNTAGEAPMGQSYWGIFADNVSKSYRYSMYPGQEYRLIAASNVRAGEFIVNVRDETTGELIMSQSVSEGNDQFGSLIEFPPFVIKGEAGDRGHFVAVEITARGVPRSDLILGQVMWKDNLDKPMHGDK
jgi:hypothetical protein